VKRMNDQPDVLSGPRLTPLSGGPASGLVVLLHGYAANGGQLIGLGKQLQQSLPDVEFVAPHGPVSLFATNLRAWAELRVPFDEVHLWRGIVATAPHLDDFVDGERDRLELSDKQVAFVGFSQGAMMALHVGLRRSEPPAAIVAYSGFVVGRKHLDEITVRPPVTLIHGEDDPVVPIEAMRLTAAALEEVDVPVETFILPDLGHTIDAEGGQVGAQALQRAFER